MTTTEDALPARDSYIVAEAAEGVAYHQLPTPKGAVLLSITSTVADLNSKITTVSDAVLCCIQTCSTVLALMQTIDMGTKIQCMYAVQAARKAR